MRLPDNRGVEEISGPDGTYAQALALAAARKTLDTTKSMLYAPIRVVWR